MRKRFLPAAAGAALLAVLAVAPPATANPTHTQTQTALDTLRTNRAAPGAAVTVRDGATQWHLSSGSRVLGENMPWAADHLFRGGSFAKPITATVVLQLVNEGRVDLDASIETYLPGRVQGNGYDGNTITVRQLLNHTSGINDYVPTSYNPFTHLFQYSLDDLADWGLGGAPYFAPGAGHRYSGTNYILAGLLIEAVTGNSYYTEVQNRIITPVGMTRTFFPRGTKALPTGHVRGYVGNVLYVDFTQVLEPSVGGSSGGVATTGADMTKFVQALLGGDLIPESLLDEMLTPNGYPGTDDYGLGLAKINTACGPAYGHGGLWPGYESYVLATKDGKAAYAGVNVVNDVMFTNSNSGTPAAWLAGVAATALCDQS